VLEQLRTRLQLSEWNRWVSGLVQNGQPSIDASDLQRLEHTVSWLFTRAWPGTDPELERALLNLRLVGHDLAQVFRAEYEERGEQLWVRKFYKDARSEQRQMQLEAAFDYHVDLVEDLAAELTRAINWVLDVARTRNAEFAAEEGRMSLTQGPLSNFNYNTSIPRYAEADLAVEGTPYDNLSTFVERRTQRDLCWGEGSVPQGLPYSPPGGAA
jgi:hypothetical protein